jgi:hypothetical protein
LQPIGISPFIFNIEVIPLYCLILCLLASSLFGVLSEFSLMSTENGREWEGMDKSRESKIWKQKQGGKPISNVLKRKVPVRSGPSDHIMSWVVDQTRDEMRSREGQI